MDIVASWNVTKGQMPRAVAFPKYYIIEMVQVPIAAPHESYFRIYERNLIDFDPTTQP
jgi:hypothetical protein